MLRKLLLKGFKLHEHTQLEARPITVLIGPNNSGKSSLFQALLLLRQAASRGEGYFCRPAQRQQTSAESPYLFAEGQLVDLGEFQHVVRRGHHEITIGVEGTVNFPKPSGLAGTTDVHFEVRVRENTLVSHRGKIEYSIPEIPSGGLLSWEWVAGGPAQVTSPPIRLNGASLLFRPIEGLQLLSPGGMSYTGPITADTMAKIQSLEQHLAQAPSRFLNSLHPIFPLRGLEEWGCPLTDAPARNLERMSVADRTVGLLSILAYDLDLQEKLSRWVEELIQVRIKVKLLPGKRVTLLSIPLDRGAEDSLFTNEGTGANQLPVILVPLGLTPPGETVLLCEPEAHLHPKAQSSLVSLLLTVAKKENRQFLIETHSEHILHSLLHAVARGDLEQKDLTIYYFDNKNGAAESRRLEMDRKGRVEGGLPGFFEHSLAELSESLEALKKN